MAHELRIPGGDAGFSSGNRQLRAGVAMVEFGGVLNLAAWVCLVTTLVWLAFVVLPDNDSTY